MTIPSNQLKNRLIFEMRSRILEERNIGEKWKYNVFPLIITKSKKNTKWLKNWFFEWNGHWRKLIPISILIFIILSRLNFSGQWNRQWNTIKAKIRIFVIFQANLTLSRIYILLREIFINFQNTWKNEKLLFPSLPPLDFQYRVIRGSETRQR